MFRVTLTIALTALAYSYAFSQSSTAQQGDKTCAFSGIYRKDGWAIPGLPAATSDGRYPRKPVTETAPSVFATKLTPVTPETTFTRIRCSRDQAGSLEIDEEPIGIVWLLSYDFEGRVFAYGVRYVDEWIYEGTRRQLGAESQLVFYDLDGSGRFTLMKGPGGPLVPDLIPDWAKNAAGAATKK